MAAAHVPDDPGEPGEAPPGVGPGRRPEELSGPIGPVVELVVAGAAGRMGGRVIALARDAANLRVVGAFERPGHPDLGRDAGEVAGAGPLG
ncbi:MAG: hypothetical protein ACREJR_04695, partial [Candidatus Rokuibacteriota bacterium]